MRRYFIITLACALALTAGLWKRSEPSEWAEGVPFSRSWDEAIALCRAENRLLLVYNGWHPSTPCRSCSELKDALHTLAEGAGSWAPYRELLQKRFSLLTVETRTPQEEQTRRGPDGPHSFIAHNVPVLVIKNPEGKTLLHRVGFLGGGEGGPKLLAKWIDLALQRQDSPDTAPWKNLLSSLLAEALHLEESERVDEALRVHAELRELAANRPALGVILTRSHQRIALIDQKARSELARVAEESAGGDFHEALAQLLSKYGRLPGFREKVEQLRLEKAQG